MPRTPPKPIIQSFLQDWNGRQSWAQQNKIPYNDFIQTVRYDYNRMTTTGYKMSDTEAFDSLSALASGHNPFSTPVDSPANVNPFSHSFNPLVAVFNDVQGIVTGLFHAPNAIKQDVVEAAHGNFSGLAQLIPGEMDIKNLMSSKGRAWLLQHPVSSVLDLGGLGSTELRLVDEAGNLTGETAVRGGIGGMLEKAGAGDMARLVSVIPSHPFSRAVTSSFRYAADNINQLDHLRTVGLNAFGHLGMLSHQAETIRSISAMNRVVGMIPEDLYHNLSNIDLGHYPEGRPILSAFFDKEDPTSLVNLVNQEEWTRVSEMYLTGKDPATGLTGQTSLRADESIPSNVREAYRRLADASIALTKLEEDRGDLVAVENPITHELGREQPNGPYQLFYRQWMRSMMRRASKGNDLALTVKTVQDGLAYIHGNDALIPASLRLGEDLVPVTTALRRVTDYYNTHIDQVYRGPAGEIPRGFRQSMRSVFGPGKRMDQVLNKLGSVRDVTTDPLIRTSIRGIRSTLNRISVHIVQDDQLTYLRETLQTLYTKVDDIQKAQLKMSKLTDEAKSADKSAIRMNKLVELRWNKYIERPYAAMVQKEFRNIVSTWVKDHFIAGETVQKLTSKGKAVIIDTAVANRAFQAIQDGFYSSPDVRAIFTDNEWFKFKNDAFMMISEFKRQGYDPLFVQAIRSTDLDTIRSPGTVRIAAKMHRSVEHSYIDPASDSMFEPAFGIVKEAQEMYLQSAVQIIQDEFVRPLALDDSQLLNESKMFPRRKIGYLVSAPTEAQLAAAYARENGYVPWEPDKMPALSSARWTYGKSERLWLKSYDMQLINKSVESMFRSFNGARDMAMGIYRVGVLYASPRYFAHIAVGGSTMLMLQLVRHPFDVVRFFNEGVRLGRRVTTGNLADVPTYVSWGVSEADLRGHIISNPIGSHNWLVGKKLGQLLGDSFAARVGNKTLGYAKAYQTVIETIANSQRAIAYLSGKAHADPALLTSADRAYIKAWNTTPEEYLGAKLANHVLADRMAQTPLDRWIIRNLIPFWGWTKHVMRYMMTYPHDHPLAASILQAVSNEALGTNSKLADYLFRLLFLGQPNEQGNVTILDARQWNPFRDTANYMTWGGWTSQLAPWFTGPLAAMGIDPTTGTADLYPTLTYDAFYGGTTAQSKNPFVSFMEQFSPQIDTLIQVAQKTSTLRQTAQRNPSKLPYLIADSLGLPWIPYQINAKQLRVQNIKDEYQTANAAVQQALLTNSMAPLENYGGLLPMSGYEVNKDYIASVINTANAYNRKNGTNIPASDLLALSYPTPYAPSYLEAQSANAPAVGIVA